MGPYNGLDVTYFKLSSIYGIIGNELGDRCEVRVDNNGEGNKTHNGASNGQSTALKFDQVNNWSDTLNKIK